MIKLLTILAFAFVSWPRPCAALSWGDFVYNANGEILEWTFANNVSASYFYNAVRGRSEIGGTTSINNIGSFLSLDLGYSVPNGEDRNQGTVVMGGNLHLDRLISSAFPDSTNFLKTFIPGTATTFFNALNVGVYTGYSTTDNEASLGFYSGLEFRWK